MTRVSLRGFEGQASAQDDNAQRDRQVVGRVFFADGSRRKIDYDAVTRKMQTGILDRGLHPLTAFLHSSVWKPHKGHAGQAIGVVYFDFNDDTIEANNSTGKNAG